MRCCRKPVSLAISLPSSLINTTQPNCYHRMSYNLEYNTPSAVAPGYDNYSEQESALHFGKIMFERFWIKQTFPVETCLINCVSYTYIPAPFLEGFFEGRAALVRPEYDEIWVRLKSDVGEGSRRGMLVWGSSGAGKSIALLFLLVQCLRNRMSVAISYVGGSHLIFDAKGVHMRDKLFPSGPSTLVVLQDAFSLAPVPYQLYRPAAGTYVVHASSPQLCRYKTFLKDRAPAVFVMTPWRREELAALLTIDPEVASTAKNMYSILEVFDYIGPSLKTVLPAQILKTGNVDADLERKLTEIKSMLISTPAEHWWMSDSEICTWIESPDPPSAYHQLFTIYPTTSPQDRARFGIGSKPAFVIKIPTSYLLTVFFSLVADRSLNDQLAWASRFTAAPGVRGALFETLGIVYLAYAMKPSRIFFRDEEQGDLIPPCLRKAPEVLRRDAVPKAGMLYVSKIGAAAIDAIWEDPTSGTVYLMNMTVLPRHPTVADGVSQVVKAYGDSKTVEDFVFVFVVPSKVIGISVIAAHGEGFVYARTKPGRRGACPTPAAVIRVGYLVIDTPRIQHLDRCVASEIQGEEPMIPDWPLHRSLPSGSKRPESHTAPSADKTKSNAQSPPSSNKKAKSTQRSRVVSQPSRPLGSSRSRRAAL